MHRRLFRGNTAANNRLKLPEGFITLDTEQKALRIHDGVSRGGYAINSKGLDSLGPGPNQLIGGDTNAGFFGEVSPDDLVAYDALSAMVGLSAGTAHNTEESLWLKFILEGKVLFYCEEDCAV